MCENTVISPKSDVSYDISTKLAYLVGVKRNFIEAIPVRAEIFDEMGKNKAARIVRNLCIIRSAILSNIGRIRTKLATTSSSIYFATEYIPQDVIYELSEDGVNFVKKGNKSVEDHIVEVNRIISDRINNCRGYFPIWLNWEYVRSLFIMPNGLTVDGVTAAKKAYCTKQLHYPFQQYINWVPEGSGNIFYDDKVCVRVIYHQQGKEFTDWSKVCDATDSVKNRIYDFIKSSDKVIIAVDCENSDPYKMCAALRNLSDEYVSRILKIILIDDVHAASAWKILENYTSIPVEYKLIERVTKEKSLVDITLSSVICKEHYVDGVNSVILFSSDSDYWALSSNLPNVDFFVMVERDAFGTTYREALNGAKIEYCYIDDFFTGNSQDIKFKALLKEMQVGLEKVNLNVKSLLDKAISTTRAELSDAEKKQFFDSCLKRMSLEVGNDGAVSFRLGMVV